MKIRLDRVQQNLAAGVDLKRRIIEELRPTLLDNVGLFAALRWQLKESCGNAGLICRESFPEVEPRFIPEAAIALFRIAQEAFNNILKHAAAHRVCLSLSIDDTNLCLRVADDGNGLPASLKGASSHGLASMRHRVRTMEGTMIVANGAEGGTVVTLQIPVAHTLIPSPEQAIP